MKKPSSWWLLLLVALGVPTVIGSLLSNVVSQHPLIAVGCILLYEIGIVIFSLVGKIWQQLESNWVKQIADFVDLHVHTLFSRYFKQYYHYLNNFHGHIDLKGLSTQGPSNPEMDQVFVDLSVVSVPSHKSRANPLQKLNKEGESIWYYLTSQEKAYKNLIIIGPPGSGKTTLLKHIALSLIAQTQKPQLRVSHKLPILLLLRDHGDAIREQPDFSLIDAIQDQLKKWNEDSSIIAWMKQKLVKGQCSILLDGLDEVADATSRRKVAEWVQRQMVKYGENRFIITSRPYGYSSNSLTGVTVLSINSLNDEKIRAFVHKWYLFNENLSLQRSDQGGHTRARVEADELLQRLGDNPNLLALTINPLLLTMVVMVHRYRGTLPGSRVELYREICDVFLGKRQMAKGLALELTIAQQLRVLQFLAYSMMINESRDISLSEACRVVAGPLKRVNRQMQPDTFLLYIENNSGLLLEREQGIYSFAHACFQEFLAAVYFQEEKLGAVLAAKVEMDWWQETIRLYCALADATPIIQACLAKEPLSTFTLALALDCQKEKRELQSEVSEQLDNLLDHDRADSDPERQRIVAEALLTRRLQRMFYAKQGYYIDRSFVTCNEYQIFIDTQLRGNNSRQPDHWTENYFGKFQGRTAALGVRASDARAFCDWLTSREPSKWVYRIPKFDETFEKIAGVGVEFEEKTEGLAYWISGGKGFAQIKESQLILNEVKEGVDLHKVFNFDLDAARDSANLLDSALHLRSDEGLTQDLANIYQNMQRIARNLNTIDELEHTCLEDLGRAYARIHALSFTLDVDRAFTEAYELAKSPKQKKPLSGISLEDLTLTHTFDLAITRALKIVHTRVLAATSTDYDKKELTRFLLEYICLLALALAIHLTSFKNKKIRKPHVLSRFSQRFIHYRSKNKQEEDIVQKMIDIYYDVYVAINLLKERVEKKSPAFEGILIIKELKENNN